MQNAAFAHHGIDAEYELREVDPSQLESFFAEARGEDWLGFNVTAPYKQAVIPLLDQIEPGAAAIGAVNSGLRLPDGRLAGFNTDALGFLAAVRAAGGPVEGAGAVVFGAGGAARAVAWALLDGGASSVRVVNRTLGKAETLAADFARLGDIGAVDPEDPALRGVLRSAALVVNATTVGMTTDGVPFDVDLLDPGAFVFDLVYVPPDTPLVTAARERGLAVVNGLEMLVRQGEVAFERWTGVAGTADVMRAALVAWMPQAGTER